MNPSIQTQIFDPLRQQFVQADGGELATFSVLFQILVELRIMNDMAQDQGIGNSLADSLTQRRADLLNEFIFSRQA